MDVRLCREALGGDNEQVPGSMMDRVTVIYHLTARALSKFQSDSAA